MTAVGIQLYTGPTTFTVHTEAELQEIFNNLNDKVINSKISITLGEIINLS
jgi:hypothetical protein